MTYCWEMDFSGSHKGR